MTDRDWSMDDVAYLYVIRGNYDGWSLAVLKDGRAVNRFEPDHYAYRRAQDAVEAYNAGRDSK